MDESQCAVCRSSQNLKRCSGCHLARYCSRQCQIGDWLNHRQKCPGRRTFEVLVNHNGKRRKLLVDGGLSPEEQMSRIAIQLSVPESRLKLIQGGRIVGDAAEFAKLARKGGKFMAIGEVGESADGLDEEHLAHLIEKMKVDRNTAIRTLRRCDNSLIDAMLHLGNVPD